MRSPPDRHGTLGRGSEAPPEQPDRYPPVPLPSAAEGAGLRAAGPPRRLREGRPSPCPAPPVPVPSVPPVWRAGGACGGQREFPGSGHIGSIQPHPPAAGSDSSAPAAGAAPAPAMAATDLERFSVSTAPLSYAPLLGHTTWDFFITRRRANNPAGCGARTPGGCAAAAPPALAGTAAAAGGAGRCRCPRRVRVESLREGLARAVGRENSG